MNRIFDRCVDVLRWLARKLGTTYQALNVWLFVIVWPLLTLGLVATIIVLL